MAGIVLTHPGEIYFQVTVDEITSEHFKSQDIRLGVRIDEPKLEKNDYTVPQGSVRLMQLDGVYTISENPDDKRVFAVGEALKLGVTPTSEQIEVGYKETNPFTGEVRVNFYVYIMTEAKNTFDKLVYEFENRSRGGVTRSATRGATRGGGGSAMTLAEFLQNSSLGAVIKGGAVTNTYNTIDVTLIKGYVVTKPFRFHVHKGTVEEAIKEHFTSTEEETLPPSY